ncbi:SIS domain-containing protein [Romboutsia sp. 1001713B170207_170306_H8]|uniref:SIS domain-containing protein n=1 Tax=Romboutsia sp. 1001713B170207_170306_H8 TaxID=2787112 RepID=UPI000822C005|nr:SIS domain-containing protein [Romboutsia sp. 1001713B170207_170306_H8]SCI04595.1 Fructosamine deglycase frlB [uncultured Clostridium sp.]
MLKFNEQEYRTSMKLICEARVDAERAADELSKRGYKNIFFTAVGGSLAPMMAIGEMAKQTTTLPVFVEQAAELLLRGHKSLGKDSIVVTMSKSGDTKETVEIAKWCKEQGITVVCLTKNPESPLAECSEYLIPMRHENGVEYEYMLLYWFFFRLLNNNGDFEEYSEFADQLEKLPENLIKAKAKFDPIAADIAKKYYQEPYMMWIGGGETWGETYLFSMCLLEEMQWLRTKSVTSAEFFHGTLELVEDDVCVFLVKGEGKCREIDNRVERFVEKYTNKFTVIDSKDYELEGIDDKFRWILAPTIISTLLVDRLAFHFEDNTGHSLDIRRYYRQFAY